MVSPPGRDVVIAWRELFSAAGRGARTFLVLTDEELSVVASVPPVDATSGTDDIGQPALPWLRHNDDYDGPIAEAFGTRSLAVRGLIGLDDGEPTVSPLLRLAVQAQQLAGRRVVAVDAGDGSSLRVAGIADLGIVTETVSADGFHAFAAGPFEAEQQSWLDWVLASDASTYRSGPRRRIVEDEWESFVADEFGADVRRIAVTSWAADAAEGYTWSLALDAGLMVSCRPDGTGYAEVEMLDASGLAKAFAVTAMS